MTRGEKRSRSLKHNKNNKALLRSEINHATDPNVRLELTKLLMGLENEERLSRKRTFFFVLVGIILVTSFFFFLGNREPNKRNNAYQQVKTAETSSLQTSSSSLLETKEPLLETQLSTPQIEKWVLAILEYAPTPPTKYLLTIKIDNTDNLVYINVGIDQLDGFGTFRVTAKGELEFNPYMSSQWHVLSTKYLETDLAKRYFAKQDEEQHKNNVSVLSLSKLQGTWGVMQTDNIITIHPDGRWTTRVMGTQEDRNIPIILYRYDDESHLFYLSIDGQDSELRILSNDEFSLKKSVNETSSLFSRME